MIDRLTAEQDELLREHHCRWREIARSCRPLDFPKARGACRLACEAVCVRPPDLFLAADSPLSCAVTSILARAGAYSGIDDLPMVLSDEVQEMIRLGIRNALAARVQKDLYSELQSRTSLATEIAWLREAEQAITEEALTQAEGGVSNAMIDRAWNLLDRYVWPGTRFALTDRLREGIREEVRQHAAAQLRRQAHGSHEAPAMSFFDYLYTVLDLPCVEPMLGLIQLARNCGWWAPHSHVAILQHRHCELHVSPQGHLHRDGGLAILYRDDFAVWCLNGVRVPQWLAETRDTNIDPRRVLGFRNVELRREFVRKVGIDRVCYSLGAKCVDKWGSYELLMLDLKDGRGRPYLKMLNPSIGTWHVEGVHPQCRTVAQALAWRDGEDTYVRPDVLT